MSTRCIEEDRRDKINMKGYGILKANYISGVHNFARKV
jgi:hypothetical protein